MGKEQGVLFSFEDETVLLRVEDILFGRQLSETLKSTRKYKQIEASIKEVGIIEPPVVSHMKGHKGQYLLLDGHMRLQILRDLGRESVHCLIAGDDEAFTYNKQVNRLATVQEHKMILKAIERGVPEERIARALDVNIDSIRRKRNLLEGISKEVATLLKDKHCPIGTFQHLKAMKPDRQLEVVELMIAMENYTVAYSKALLAATPQHQLLRSNKPKRMKNISPGQMALMEREMSRIQNELKLVEDSYGPEHLKLVVARGYVTSLTDNIKVAQYLELHYSEIYEEFRQIGEIVPMSMEEESK